MYTHHLHFYIWTYHFNIKNISFTSSHLHISSSHRHTYLHHPHIFTFSLSLSLSFPGFLHLHIFSLSPCPSLSFPPSFSLTFSFIFSLSHGREEMPRNATLSHGMKVDREELQYIYAWIGSAPTLCAKLRSIGKNNAKIKFQISSTNKMHQSTKTSI